MSKTSLKLYRCENKTCTVGPRSEPGYFTGGVTANQVVLLTGRPLESLVDGVDYGEGICPNCATKATPTKDRHVSVVGEDPHQHHHDAVAARVADPADPLTVDGAQEALEELVS